MMRNLRSYEVLFGNFGVIVSGILPYQLITPITILLYRDFSQLLTLVSSHILIPLVCLVSGTYEHHLLSLFYDLSLNLALFAVYL